MSRTIDILGWFAGASLALLMLSTVAMTEFLVHLSIEGIEAGLPYKFADEVVRQVDVAGDNHQLRLFTLVTLVMLGLSLLNVCLVWRMPKARASRAVMCGILLAGMISSAAFAAWVHTIGLRRVSPFLADSQVVRSWPCWLFATVLLSLFSCSCAFRITGSGCDEQQTTISWYRGPKAYLNERRLVLIAVSASLILILTDAKSIEQFLQPRSWRGWYDEAPGCMPLAVLWLSLRGALMRRRTSYDQEMRPIQLAPREFLITSIAVAVVTIALADSIAWASFAVWLL